MHVSFYNLALLTLAILSSPLWASYTIDFRARSVVGNMLKSYEAQATNTKIKKYDVSFLLLKEYKKSVIRVV
jgi:hypothetical protein